MTGQLAFFPEGGAPGSIEAATRGQLDRLEADGILTAAHDILRAAILGLAHSMDRSAAKGQSVGLAQASKELREWYMLIPQAPGPEDPFETFMKSMTKQGA